MIEELAKEAIDIHCHGIGRFDFTEISKIDLLEIESILASRPHQVVLTLYLPKQNFDDFFILMDNFSKGKQAGRLPHIAGIGLEGPLLASHGGTPHKGVWNPSKREWKMLAQCGRQGLIYIIYSPDAFLDKFGSSNIDAPATSPSWIAETLLDGGVLPAAGHFTKENPLETARALQEVYDVVSAWGKGPTITDHLYNDMPRNFKHAWRGGIERARREHELAEMNLGSWSLNNIEEKIGLVPATMIRNAHKGLVKIAQNFDGEHVDLAIVKKTVDLVGAENMLMMTDSIESRRLAGRDLHMHTGSTLLYQDDDIVAAGSQDIYKQINNMLFIGLTASEIKYIINSVPLQIIENLKANHGKTEAACF